MTPRCAAWLLVAILVGAPGRAPAGEDGLIAPVRCVSDYLEAVSAAAPPRPRRARRPAAVPGIDSKWNRALSYLLPPVRARLEQASGPELLAPWVVLGPDGAFLGYELLSVRRAPRAAAVVVVRERTVRTPSASPEVSACAYLVGRQAGTWRIADKRCGRDFADDEVRSGYAGLWDEPPSPAGTAGAPTASAPADSAR